MVSSKPAFEYDAPMFYDFEASESPVGRDRVDDWFDTSATKGLQSPTASGSGNLAEKGRDKERDVTSAERVQARTVLGEITNAAAPSLPKESVHASKPALKVTNAVHKPVTRSQSGASVPSRPGGAESCSKAAEPSVPRPHVKPPHRGRHLTVPKSPMLLSRLRSGGRVRVKSTEELELEQIERERQAMATNKRKPALVGGGGGEKESRSTKRLKTESHHVTSGGFTVGAEAPCQQKGVRRSTRSSTRAKGGERAWRPKLTVPQSPAFATNSRVRAPRYKSTEEIQLEEIAKVRLAKGVGKKMSRMAGNVAPFGEAKTAPTARSGVRPASLKIPDSNQNANGSRGAKSTTAARSMRATRSTTARSARSARSAASHPPQPSVFGEGPITRNRAHVVETKKRDKSKASVSRAAKGGTTVEGTLAPRVAESSLGAEGAAVTEDAGNETKKNTMNTMKTRPRPASRGASMLRGGAMRVVRTEPDDQEIGRNTPGSPSKACIDTSPPTSRHVHRTRGRSILERIAGAQKTKAWEMGTEEPTQASESTPPKITFEQLRRRNRHHNPLFEFKQ